MRLALRILSAASLGLLLLAAVLYLLAVVEKPTLHTLLLIGTLGWFVTAPFIFGRDEAEA